MEEYKVPTDEDREAFQKHLDDVEKKKKTGVSVDIDNKERKAASNELELQKRGHQYDEPDELERIQIIAASLPKGTLADAERSELPEKITASEIGLSKESVERKIEKLTEVRQAMLLFKDTPEMEGLDEVTLSHIKEGMVDASQETVDAAGFLLENDFAGSLHLWELAGAIMDQINEDKIILKNI